jgi:hypothetical protein
MAVKLSALRARPPQKFLVLISVRVWVDPRAIVRLEGLGQLKNPMTSSRIHYYKFSCEWIQYGIPGKFCVTNSKRSEFQTTENIVSTTDRIFFLRFRFPFSMRKFPTYNLVTIRFQFVSFRNNSIYHFNGRTIDTFYILNFRVGENLLLSFVTA